MIRKFLVSGLNFNNIIDVILILLINLIFSATDIKVQKSYYILITNSATVTSL